MMQSGSSAPLRAAALLLCSALVCPALAQAQSARTGLAAIMSPDADFALPDLPAAAVTINPSDLDIAPPARAKPVAGTAAPSVRTIRPPAASATLPVSKVALPSPRPAAPASQAEIPSDAPTAAPDVRRDDAPNAAGKPLGPKASIDDKTGSVGDLGGAGAPPPAVSRPEPDAEAPVADVPARPADAAPPVARSAVLDAATLHQAIDAYVGVEPPPLAGRVPAPDLARFKERQAVAAVYAGRSYAPLWIEDGRFDAKARSVLSRIDHAPEDGLDLRSITVAVPPRGADAAALAASELSLTQAAIAYAKQASGGRVDPARLWALVAAKPEIADGGRVIETLAAAADVGEALRGFNPPHKGYQLLRTKLAELRQTSDVAGQPIPYGRILKPGMSDPRVPLIRTRFGLDIPPSDSPEAGLVYDTRVAAAVADFQRAHHLPPSGVLTIRTVATLSGGNPRRLEGEIIANMERWRWLPRELGENYIQVNIPNFTLDVMHGETVFHHTRVVVGQPDKPTPVFSETMKFIIVNPYWNVPLSIVKKEMMPKAAEDPNYFANHGYEVVERNGVTYVRQPPGESNALGRIKFMFPNSYAVYLHDTNARALFGNDKRALSHGCVRVEAPFKLAEAVLGKENGWTEARVKKMIGGGERTINLPAPLPIHIVYFTAFVDDKGELQLRDDVYGYSAKLRQVLGLEG